MSVSTLIDLTGQRFGRLTVVERSPDYVQHNGRHRARWKCVCDCGSELITNGDALRAGRTTSCGCFRKELMSEIRSTHHETSTKLYGVWCAIKRRCYNKNAAHYEDYGGRGILMCDTWRDNYESFRDWAYSHWYHESLTIDRVDNSKGYSPENCRWVDCGVQASNRRSNVNLTFCGETHTLTEWADKVGVNRGTMFSRYYAGWSVERMLST